MACGCKHKRKRGSGVSLRGGGYRRKKRGSGNLGRSRKTWAPRGGKFSWRGMAKGIGSAGLAYLNPLSTGLGVASRGAIAASRRFGRKRGSGMSFAGGGVQFSGSGLKRVWKGGRGRRVI